MTLSAVVGLKVKAVLEWLQILELSDEITPALLISIFKGLMAKFNKGPLEFSGGQSDEYKLKLYLDTFSFELLRLDLSHISPSKLATGDSQTIKHFIDVVYEVAIALGMIPFTGAAELEAMEEDQGQEMVETNEEVFTNRISSDSGRTSVLIDDIPETHPTTVEPFNVAPPRKSSLKTVRFNAEPEIRIFKKPNAPVFRHHVENTQSRMRKLEAKVISPRARKKKVIFKGNPFSLKNCLDDEVEESVSQLSSLVENLLPNVDVPDHIKKTVKRRQVQRWQRILSNAIWQHKVEVIKHNNAQQNAITGIPAYIDKEIEHARRLEEKQALNKKKMAAGRSVEDRKIQAIRVERFHNEAETAIKSAQVQRKAAEERLLQTLIEEAFKLEQEALRDMQRMKREEDAKAKDRKQIETESKRRYLRDQMEMLTEELERVKLETKIREKAQKEQERSIIREQKEEKRKEIRLARERLQVDATDFYFREKAVENAAQIE